MSQDLHDWMDRRKPNLSRSLFKCRKCGYVHYNSRDKNDIPEPDMKIIVEGDVPVDDLFLSCSEYLAHKVMSR